MWSNMPGRNEIALGFLERRCVRVLFRDDRRRDGPRDGQRGIVVSHGAFRFRAMHPAALVVDQRIVFQRHEPVRETARQPQPPIVACSQRRGDVDARRLADPVRRSTPTSYTAPFTARTSLPMLFGFN